MKRALLISTVVLIFISRAFTQAGEFTVQNYHPVSPTAFQFLKYTEMPVSEYTGVANISIPLYQVQEDGITIPLSLTYHSGGFRTNDEASWVGLGWDLTVGSIVQEVNNIDDYTAAKLMQPDYQNYGGPPTFLPERLAYGTACPLCNGPGWSNPYPIFSGTPTYSYAVATNYYMPINGNFDDQQDGQTICQEGPGNSWDSDPDIFKASFLGHEITFTMNYKNSQIVVLNKPGYTVTRTSNTYEIVVPSGEQFYFAQNTVDSGYSSQGGLSSQKIWMLTKIITNHKKQILFNYTAMPFADNFPSYSERWDSLATLGGLGNLTACILPSQDAYFGLLGVGAIGKPLKTFGYTTENKLYLSSIVFPNGQVNFYTSNRSDLLGGQKLDSIQVNGLQTIKSFYFNYNYFNSSGVGGNTYQPSNISEFGNAVNLRLELLTLKDNSGATHTFSYNQTTLPAKNSLAQDFWGFFNGQLNNTTIIPNPARINLTQLGNNGTNNSASPYFSQACMLTQIQYPTGGRDSMEYQLNQFSNYWVPDSSSITNTISHGDGLCIHAIDYFAATGIIAKRTIYTYNGGIGIVPLDMYRNFAPTIDAINGGNLGYTNYSAFELCSRGFYSSNVLGSINGVGYSEVIKQDVSASGSNNGSTQTFFFNTQDKVSNCGITASQVAAALPATKDVSEPENGSIDSVMYFDNQNKLLKKIINTYTNVTGTYFYGARIFGYGAMIVTANCGNGTGYWYPLNLTLIGFYPIFDFETLPYSTTTTEYAGNDSLVTTQGFSYDNYNQLFLALKYTPAHYEQDWFEYPYANRYYSDAISQTYLMNDHRFSEVVYRHKASGPYPWQESITSTFTKHYGVASNGAIVENSLVLRKNLLVPTILPDSITYDTYDPTYANLLQYTDKNMSNVLIWDYNGEYVIAEVKNAKQSNTAYTSFESNGNGNWTFTGTASNDPTSPTGNYSYNLSQTNGSITKSGLTSSSGYIVSYWSKTGTNFTVTGSSSVKQGKTITRNGASWTYFEHIITGINSTTISGTGNIDELRLYPSNALMRTYTYTPIIGMTSECDINNKVTYYNYDGFARLIDIRDQDGNIIKTMRYHYSGGQ
jgi:YD repeat-containing protein